MKKKHREILAEIEIITRWFGGEKDLTSTHPHKLIYIQRSHRDVAEVIYNSIFCDHPENDQRDYNLELGAIHLNKLRWLINANFSDRNGKGLISEEFNENKIYESALDRFY